MKPSPSTRRVRRRGLAALATGAVLAGAVYGLGPGAALASSHREAPLIAADPAVDNTDLYAFVSPERPDSMTFVANFIPFEEPNGGPNFYPFATDAGYNIFVDSDGDAKPDVTFRYTFKTIDKRGNATFLYNNGPVTSLDDENLLFRQTYTLETTVAGQQPKTRIKDAPVAPSRVGNASMPDYGKLRDAAVITAGGLKSFAGQADDPFFLDLRVFDLLYGGDLSEVGQDTLAGYNVNTIALQVPLKEVALKGDPKRNPVIGIWSTTDRKRVKVNADAKAPPAKGGAKGGAKGAAADAKAAAAAEAASRVQVSRLGNPLVNEVVVPAALKDAFNASSPAQDGQNATLVKRVTDPEVPQLIQKIYRVPAPAAPRNDLVEIFLTGITTKATGPIQADLNSQLNNTDVKAAKFVPSEMLRLNLSVPVNKNPNRLGVLAKDLQGFPNGRRLGDDVVDIEVQALEGAAQSGKIVDALKAGDKVDANDNAFGGNFPYLALPNVAAVNGGNRASNGLVPEAAPATKPAGFATGATRTLIEAATIGIGVAAVVTLVVLFLVGWLRRRESTGNHMSY